MALKPPYRQGCSVAVGGEEEPGDPRFTERAAPAQHALEFLSPLLSNTVERSVSVWLSHFSLRGHVASPVHTWQDCSVTSPARPSWILDTVVLGGQCVRQGCQVLAMGTESSLGGRLLPCAGACYWLLV